MAHPLPEDGPMSVEEYLRFEAAAESRHEYVAGEVYAMVGGTMRHAQIVTNLVFRLQAAARGGPCRVIASEVKLRVGSDRFYYPDVMVVGTPVGGDALVVHDPCVVIEVTSPSTARVDRGEKREAYLRGSSVRAYLVVDHRRRRVEWHARDVGGAWRRGEVTGAGAVDVPCPPLSLTLDEIYEDVAPTTVRERAAEYATDAPNG